MSGPTPLRLTQNNTRNVFGEKKKKKTFSGLYRLSMECLSKRRSKVVFSFFFLPKIQFHPRIITSLPRLVALAGPLHAGLRYDLTL